MNHYHVFAMMFWIESVFHCYRGEKAADGLASIFAIIFFIIGEFKL